MYSSNRGQRSVFDDATNFIGAKLSPENRWVKLAGMIPWDWVDEKYSATFKTLNVGQPAKAARMAVGTLIIREKQKISDEETVEQISENPYLQWFIGLNEFTDKAPFDKSTITLFRKRVTPEILSEINEYITGRKKAPGDDDEPKGGGAGSCCGAEETNGSVGNKGTMIVDATCVPADIKYPTDVNLLNDSREKLEQMILQMHKQIGAGQKAPRVYKKEARKSYLRFARNRKPKQKDIRHALKKQLGYVRRNLSVARTLVEKGGQLTKRQRKELKTIETIYEQQERMYREKIRHIDNRIVSIHQDWVRPIVRGKTNAAVEFGAKVSISMMNGYSFIEKLSFDAYNESGTLIESIEDYKAKTGFYPERILADRIYRTRANLQYCKEHDIRMNGPKLGRPYKDKGLYRLHCLQEKAEAGERNAVEGKFGEGKRRYYLNRTMTRLKETTATQIHLTFLVMNLSKRLRASLRPISDMLCAMISGQFFTRKGLLTATIS